MANDLLQELEQIALAVHMLRLEARTRTVGLATRLSEEKIRRIYRRYRQQHSLQSLTRHRGRTPSQPLQYARSGPMQLEAATWASLLLKHGLLRGRRPRPWLDQALVYGQRFCDAFVEYLTLSQAETLSFEQAWHFAKALAMRDVLRLQRCQHCSSHFVRDITRLQLKDCPLCQLRQRLGATGAIASRA